MSGYFSEARVDEIAHKYPSTLEGFNTFATKSRDEIESIQTSRLFKVVARAWQVPFYERRWRAAGLEPGAIRTLEDLQHIPSFSKSDLMESVAQYPPFGDFHGMDDLHGEARRQVVFHSTSGTTGDPQPLFFGAHDREVQNALLARVYRMHGLRDDDVVHSVYGFGLVNGGHYVREAVTHFTRALMVTAGTGVDTPSERQVRLMARFGTTVLVGFADYLFRLGEVAQELGLQPGKDLSVRLISGHIPHDRREALSALWGGARVCDWYGVGDTGVICAEREPAGGLWVFEDAQILEIIDADTGAVVAPGEPGNQCVTCLFKDTVYPIVRFNTQDVSAIDADSSPGDWNVQRTQGFLGRSDNMVKLRGINVYPTSVGAHLGAFAESNGEYICRLTRKDGKDELAVDVEWSAPAGESSRHAVSEHLREALGVRVNVNLVKPGDTAASTGIAVRQKPIRLVDERTD